MSRLNASGLITISPELLAFQKYVAEKTAISSQPLRTATWIWTRRLCAPDIIPPDEKPIKRAPSTFAKFNDGLGESGITLEEAKQGIRDYFKQNKAGNEL